MDKKLIIIVLIFFLVAIIVGWATQLCKGGLRKNNKYGGNAFVEHHESEKDWVNNSSVCPFGKVTGLLFICYCLSVIIVYTLVRLKATNKKTLDTLDIVLFWITLMFILIVSPIAFIMNTPLFIRLIPACILLFISLFVFNMKN